MRLNPNPLGTDVILDTGIKKNLSYFTPGENLFPKMFVNENDYSVTWINYKKGDVKLSFYDSFSEYGRVVVSERFDFVSSDTSVIFDREKPRFIVFRAIKGNDNEDVFIHDLKKGRTIRIAETDGNEKEIIIDDNKLSGRSSFVLKTYTLDHEYTYVVKKANIKIILKDDHQITRGAMPEKPNFSSEELNTIVGFGDSITWGKMRMYNLFDLYHPELTYWAKTSEYFNENYGQTYTINLGVNRDSSLQGLQRMDEELRYQKGYFLLVLFGTNDVTSGSSSSTSTSQNILQILKKGRDDYGMFPVVSTVPPQKLYLSGIQFYKDETEKLNEKIIALANANDFQYIDTYNAFFNQTEGWEAMLEDIKGNHPSPSGHQVMADMVIPIILEHAPGIPSDVSSLSGTRGSSFNISCTENKEFDFDYYNVKFGFSPSLLNREMKSSSNVFSVYFYPFNLSQRKKVYFKMQAIDKDGNASSFTQTYSVSLN